MHVDPGGVAAKKGPDRRLRARRPRRLGSGFARTLALAHRVSYLVQVVGGQSARVKRGTGEMQFPQRDQRIGSCRCESPMAGSPPLGPGCITGRRRQCRPRANAACAIIRHNPTAQNILPPPRSSSRAVGGRMRRGGLHGFFRRRSKHWQLDGATYVGVRMDTRRRDGDTSL